jgi:putative ABC transport system permease protein
MRHWSQLATRNSRAKPIRTLGAILAIALGTGSVIWVTCCYESVRRAAVQWSSGYVGRSHINVESTLGNLNPFAERVVDVLRRLDYIHAVVPTLSQRLTAAVVPEDWLRADRETVTTWNENLPVFELMGIDPELEPIVRDHEVVDGRMLQPGDRQECVLEAAVAREADVRVGDYLLVWSITQPQPFELKIVGLVERRRVAKFQKPLAILPIRMLQEMAEKHRLITAADIVLAERSQPPEPVTTAPAPRLKGVPLTNPTADQLREARDRVRQVVQRYLPTNNIRDASTRLAQIETAQSQQELVLALLSSVALLTSLFIILSTLSMGLIERVGQLGLLRCIGLTRWQLAKLVLYEVFPLGLVGIAAGVPIGLGLTALTVYLVPDWFSGWAISYRGLALAIGGGLATTLLAAALPAFAAIRITPLEASRPYSRPSSMLVVAIVTLFAVGLLAVQHWLMLTRVYRSVSFVYWASASIVLLYIAYALLAPLVVRLVGAVSVAGVAAALGLRRQILQDQVGHAVWRSAGICCGMMVGLSLIVTLAAFNASFRAGWQFPKRFPGAYVWSFEQIPDRRANALKDIPGLANYTVGSAQNAIVYEKPLLSTNWVKSVTWFLGCDPDTFFDLLQLEFLKGNRDDALAKLKAGGHIIVADDFARSRNVGVGDKVKVWIGPKMNEFEIAAVIDSPALDVAATYFQAQSQMQVVAVGSVIGSRDDLRRLWDIDSFNLVLMNLDVPDLPVPADWPPPPSARRSGEAADYIYDEKISREVRWRRYQESAILRQVQDAMQSNMAFAGSVSELKAEIDSSLNRITGLLVAVPLVALLVAALGVANLMTANVASRARQIAIMRAVGATRSQILRMVCGEALVLGVLGSALGLALGMHLAYNTRIMSERMWGFDAPAAIPWAGIGASVALTITLCLLAGMLPARHAARANVIDALRVT